MRIALDLKTYGPTYAQFRLVVLDGPLANVAVSLVLEPREREPEESPEELKGLGKAHVVEFHRGVLTRGEEILVVPPPAHAGDVGGMDMDLLCHLFASARVVVEYDGLTERETAAAEIGDLGAYWTMLSEAGIVDTLDPGEELRAVLDRSTRSLTHSLDGLADQMERSVAFLARKQVREVSHTPVQIELGGIPSVWRFWRRGERKQALRAREVAIAEALRVQQERATRQADAMRRAA